MTKVINSITDYFSPYYRQILIACIVVIFLVMSVYIYYNYISPKLEINTFDNISNDNQRTDTSSSGGNANLYFFSADWCPHCTVAKPEWESFKSTYDGKEMGKYTLVCNNVDCTDNGASDPKVAQLMSTYNVSSFPTVKLQMPDSSIINFDSKIREDTLTSFVNTMLK
jgi:thiol-disulfide isomerase/thioredoxin